MKRKTLSVVLALCLSVTMLCALAFTANAEATVKKVDLMVGTDYAIAVEAADDGSVITYTKNKEVDLTDSEGNPFKGWAQEIVTVTNEATDEWNTKFYYDADASLWKLVLKGAKLDTYNNDTDKAVASSYLVSGSQQGNAAYTLTSMNVVIQEDSYVEGTTNFRSNCGGSSGKWKALNFISLGDAKLHMNYTSYGAYTQCSITVNANMEINTVAGTAFYMNKGDGVLTFESGNSVINTYRLCSGENRFLTFKGGNVTATLSHKVCNTAFAADHVTVNQEVCYTLKNDAGEDLDPNGISGLKSVIFASHTHTAAEAADDGDCSTAVVYSCGKEVVPAKQHTAGANNDCTKATPCANEGCTKDFAPAAATAHTPAADDGDCTTDIMCANAGCAQVATKGAEKHTYTRTDCTVDSICSVCNKVAVVAGSHTGGTATCQAKAKCEVCQAEYGELGACVPAADDGDCTTEIKCSLCGKTTTAGEAAHKYTDKNDTTCDNAGCTNTRKVEGTENPKTGDNSAIAVVAALMVTAAAAFVTTKKFAR